MGESLEESVDEFNAYPRISTTIFLPHLNFEIFWGFPLSYVVSWRGL